MMQTNAQRVEQAWQEASKIKHWIPDGPQVQKRTVWRWEWGCPTQQKQNGSTEA